MGVLSGYINCVNLIIDEKKRCKVKPSILAMGLGFDALPYWNPSCVAIIFPKTAPTYLTCPEWF